MMQILLISVLLQFGHSAQYEVTEEACANDLLFISSAEECEAAANALGITWNSCCQNNNNLPYGCLKRSDNDVIWNGNANTPNQFPCTVAGNCDHGMRWAVCFKGDDSVFLNEGHKKCCLDGWTEGTDCQHGCWNCACSDGTAQCGCIHNPNVDQDDYLQSITPAAPTSKGFVLGDQSLSWTAAKEWCESRGYQLASIHSAEENAAAVAVQGDNEAWIGGRRTSADFSKWEWSDGTEWSYTNWEPREPNNQGNEECLMMYKSPRGTWNDISCDASWRPICQEPQAHLVVQGRTSWGGWGSAPDSYCQSDDDNQAAYDSSKHSRNIGVGCCSTDGTKGYRPDCNAHPATYQEAVDLCAQNGYRLCTEHEMLFGKSNGKGITEGTGCWYDAAYQWVSDECDVETAAAAAASGSNKSGASDGEDSSFDDFIPMVLGAAAGIAVIAGIVALVVAMRKKKVTEETVTEMSDVVHVPDASAVSVDGDEAVATR